MAELVSADEIKREIFKRYNKDPKGWQVLAGRDRKGFSDIAVVHGDEVWFIKEEQLNPYSSVGYGVRDLLAKDVENLSPFEFGLRAVSREKLEEIRGSMKAGEGVDQAMSRIMSLEPVPFETLTNLKGAMFAQGPVMFKPKGLSGISERQKALDGTLRVELEKLLYKKHRQTLVPYI